MNRDEGVTRRTFLSKAAAAATLASTPMRLVAQDVPVAPPEIATPGRPQGTDKFGPSVDNVPIIDSHIHLFDGRRTQGAGYMGSAAYRAQSQIALPGMIATISRPSGIVGAIIVESSATSRRQRMVPGRLGRPIRSWLACRDVLIRTARSSARIWRASARIRCIAPFVRAVITRTPTER